MRTQKARCVTLCGPFKDTEISTVRCDHTGRFFFSALRWPALCRPALSEPLLPAESNG
jgi:hypothetical protein